MMKRILQFAGAVSLRRIFFLRSALAEKSYLQSAVLRPESVRHNLMLGMEQGGGTHLPEVTVVQGFRSLPWEELTGLGRLALFADPAAPHGIWQLMRSGGKPSPPSKFGAVLCVGPERGFTDGEREILREAGFTAVSFGESILRVESAVTFLYAQTQLILSALEERTGAGFQ
jgi:RsmE family RNA methyltransferase